MEILSLLDKHEFISGNLLIKQVVIILLYAIIAKVADIIINRVLRKIAQKTKVSVDDILIDYLHVPIIWTIIGLGVQHALILREMQAPWKIVLPAFTQSVVLFVWLVAIIRVLSRLVHIKQDKVISRGKIGADLFYLIKNLARVVIIVAGILWLLAIWEIDMTPLFASAGIAGIAVALAAKDTLANFFGGISIFADNAYKVSDYIILDSGERGEVVQIGIRSTRIKTRDDVLVTIPNSIMATSKIINESAPIPRFRIRVPVGVAYGSNLQQVEEVLLDVAKENKNVTEEPAPRVRVRSFADSSVNFELLCWVGDPSLKGLEIHNLLKSAYKSFDENKISIPFPQRDVHIIDQ